MANQVSQEKASGQYDKFSYLPNIKKFSKYIQFMERFQLKA